MTPSEELSALRSEAERCVACALHATRTNVVFGSGSWHAPLMLVGEGPGRDEDLSGEPFVGRSGRLLESLLVEEVAHGRDWCYIANIVKCRPPGNRDPQPAEMGSCRHFLDRQIALVAPRLVMTLGNVATRALLETNRGITSLRGSVVERGGYAVLPTFHPAAALRSGPPVLDRMREDFRTAADFLASSHP